MHATDTVHEAGDDQVEVLISGEVRELHEVRVSHGLASDASTCADDRGSADGDDALHQRSGRRTR